MKLVVDASPLILFTASETLDLLPGLAEEIVITEVVLEELEAGESKDVAVARVKAAAWMTIGQPDPASTEVAAWDLGPGETAVLAWAEKRPGFTCVLDDRAARNCATVPGLPCVGTLGLVLAAKEAGLVQAARPIIEAMVNAGYFLAGEILEHALRGVGE